jgi:hypothetical protein
MKALLRAGAHHSGCGGSLLNEAQAEWGNPGAGALTMMMKPMTPSFPITILSGGQTGVDRGALDAALELGFPCGGWCPPGRLDEEGTIPDRYPLREMAQGGYKARTLQNLKEADGTLIIHFGDLEGGTELTVFHCMQSRRPYRLIDGWEITPERAAELALDFVQRQHLRTLNVAGPRASRRAEAQAYAYTMIRGLLERLGRKEEMGKMES